MEHSPPPFFKTGPTPLARLLIFSCLAFALLVADARFKYLETLRQIAAVILYPLQRIASAPASIVGRVGEFFVTQSALREENTQLRRENLDKSVLAQKAQSVEAENANLRKLLGARERSQMPSTIADVLYAARDPFSRRIVIDKGAQQDVKSGQPVIDGAGVVGQVTRVYPMLAEVTLITDKDHLVPVLNVRNGLRTVLAGTGADGTLELRFAPLSADVQKGDQLVTSGIDGVYPPGLPVAEVTTVDRNSAAMFAKITCKPLGGVANHTRVFVLHAKLDTPERPPEEVDKPVKARKGRRGG